jgi:hypothetical protein
MVYELSAAASPAATAGSRTRENVGAASSGTRMAENAKGAHGAIPKSRPPAARPTRPPASIASSCALVARARPVSSNVSGMSARCAVVSAFRPV